jgi:acetolactate synthase-1/2/3 large subunit
LKAQNKQASPNTAQALVRILEKMGVETIFGIPGAKIDSVFEALLDSKIRLVVCRHEQNAAFMAAAVGRLTGKIGVVLVTSGPGVGNLATGLATATTEGDPVLAIGGEVPLEERSKSTHQSLLSVTLMRPVTKYAAEIVTPAQIGELVGEAVRAAETGRPGATFLSLPRDVGLAPCDVDLDLTFGRVPAAGTGATSESEKTAKILAASKKPTLLLGMQASDPRFSEQVRHFIATTGIPFVSTFQGPGEWAAGKNRNLFGGRIGLFKNQPGDRLLATSDCVMTIGYDPVEYDPEFWNDDPRRPILAVDSVPARQDRHYLPVAELIGDIGSSLAMLQKQAGVKIDPAHLALAAAGRAEIDGVIAAGGKKSGFPVHPLRILHELTKVITEETTVALDVGSHYIWMNRYFAAQRARQILVSNGQQTLGVALPWAIATHLLRPGKPIISVSGDGGFMFSSTELETAVRVGARFVHLVWDSGSYDMVAFQEQAHYGKTAGIELGHVEIPKFAESFGCRGVAIQDVAALGPALREGLASPVPFLIQIPVDYSENLSLMKELRVTALN